MPFETLCNQIKIPLKKIEHIERKSSHNKKSKWFIGTFNEITRKGQEYADKWLEKSLENLSNEEADKLIKSYKPTIEKVAKSFGVDKYIIAGVIYKERVSTDYLDNFDAFAGIIGTNTSIGIGQVKVSTAQKLENRWYITRITKKEIQEAGSEQKARVARLVNNSWNINYVAAYLKNLQDIRKGKFPSINKRPDILATLYNIGKEEAHSNPQPNDYGRAVQASYSHMKRLMG